MPERVTKEERMVSLAIEKARKTIEALRESTQVIPVDTEVEVQKIKRPKVQDASKITNQTQEKEGYGLAGESLKKAKFSGPPRKRRSGADRDVVLISDLSSGLREINRAMEAADKTEDVHELKLMLKRAQKVIDRLDEMLLDAKKYGKGSILDAFDRKDSKYLSVAGAKFDESRDFE